MRSKRLLINAVIITLAIVSLNSCFLEGSGVFDRITGEGPEVSKEINIPRIHGIVIKNSANVILRQGDDQKLEVKAQRNIIENIRTEVSNGILYVGSRRPVWKTKPIQMNLRLSDLNIVKISGSGKISMANTFTDVDDLEVNLSGSGNIDLSVEAREIYCNISGSGSINLEGKAREGEYVISGSGSIHATDLKLKKAYARVSGSGGIHLDVKDDLEARITGSGNIYYQGNPSIDKRITGSGNIRSK